MGGRGDRKDKEGAETLNKLQSFIPEWIEKHMIMEESGPSLRGPGHVTGGCVCKPPTLCRRSFVLPFSTLLLSQMPLYLLCVKDEIGGHLLHIRENISSL